MAESTPDTGDPVWGWKVRWLRLNLHRGTVSVLSSSSVSCRCSTATQGRRVGELAADDWTARAESSDLRRC